MMIRMRLMIFWLFFSVVLMPLPAYGCPIPVYRYALEFWEPDPYRVTVYYSEALTAFHESAVRMMADASAGRAGANLDVRLVDVEGETELLDYPLYGEQSADELPWMIVQYPYIEGIEEPLWGGPLTAENAGSLLYSPAREHIAGRLADGIKVWLILESGDRGKDRQAGDVLERELGRLEQTLELPDPEQWWTGRDDSEKPEIKFETYSISRDDPSEKFLISMLLHSEDDLAEFGSEPIVFPLFGRGIALWAIVGKGINAWNITDAAEFLTGPCSCQVKMLNPGVDLLIAKDWESAVEKISDAMLTPVTGFAEFEARGEEAARRLEAEETDADGADIRYVDIFGEGRVDAEETERALEEGGAPYGFLPRVLIGLAVIIIIGGLTFLKTSGKK